MIYDIIKVVKKCLKFWYIFVVTGVVGMGLLLLSSIPIREYQGGFRLDVNSINQQKIMKENGDLEYYYYLSNAIVDKINNEYSKNIKDRVCSQLNLNGNNLNISIKVNNGEPGTPIEVLVSDVSKDSAIKINNFLKEDLSEYIQTASDANIPVSYMTGEYTLLYDEIEPYAVLTRSAINFVLCVVMIIVLEVFVVGMYVLKKNIVLFDEEINSAYGKEVLVKNYTNNIAELNIALKNRGLTQCLIIGEKWPENKLLDGELNIKYVDINNQNIIKENLTKDSKIIIEVVKDKTEVKTIEEILNLAKLQNVEDIYFITRNKEKNNESVVSK